ncbi:hypothetical protein [Wolbachia endosymbiont (group A) of Icerya purchasi]|uniref:hypothetical protein n=1 Tax=Wolbachia endosymbiont (group A) of Icerya purchasi TaxID=2954019 RepID=UPI00222FA015|nr:hypothetical protein [Wolbachia endosymbiont (group A) of Icerya purchasi]
MPFFSSFFTGFILKLFIFSFIPFLSFFTLDANSGLKENRKGRKQGKLSSYKKIDEVTHGRYNKTVLFGR